LRMASLLPGGHAVLWVEGGNARAREWDATN
jgi:hypothetical protein